MKNVRNFRIFFKDKETKLSELPDEPEACGKTSFLLSFYMVVLIYFISYIHVLISFYSLFIHFIILYFSSQCLSYLCFTSLELPMEVNSNIYSQYDGSLYLFCYLHCIMPNINIPV